MADEPSNERTANGRFAPGNSGRKRSKHRREERRDGFVNVFLGHGTERDRATATHHFTNAVLDFEAIDLRRGNWLAKRIVEMLPADAFRRGYDLKLDDKETAEEIQGALEELDLDAKMVAACQMERCCGGAALFPVLDGAQGELAAPLDDTRITAVRALHLYEPRELYPASWYTDITNPKFGLPETYRLDPLSGGAPIAVARPIIHESRLAIFPGIRVTREPLHGQRWGWGDNVLTPVNDVIQNFGLTWGSVAALLHDFAQGVIKLDQLIEMLKDDDGEKLVQKRLAVMDMARSSLRAMVLDKNDEFSRTTTPVSGLAELVIQLSEMVSAAADTPRTRLFGTSPAGLNATGKSDDDGWNDRVNAEQARRECPLEFLIGLVIKSSEGPTGGKEPDLWSVQWRPLDDPDEKQIAETRKLNAEADKIWFDMGAVSSDDVAKSHWGGDTYSADLTVDFKAREEQKKIDEEQAKLLDAQALAAMGRQPPNGANGTNGKPPPNDANGANGKPAPAPTEP